MGCLSYEIEVRHNKCSCVLFKMPRSSEHNKGYKNRETFAVKDQNDWKKASTGVELTSVDVKTGRNTELNWKRTGATFFPFFLKRRSLKDSVMWRCVYIQSLYTVIWFCVASLLTQVAAGFITVPSDGGRCDLIGCSDAEETKRDTCTRGMKKWQMKIRTSVFLVTCQRLFPSAYR